MISPIAEKRLQKYGEHLSEEEKQKLSDEIQRASDYFDDYIKTLGMECGRDSVLAKKALIEFGKKRDAAYRKYGIPAPGEAPEDKEALEEALK